MSSPLQFQRSYKWYGAAIVIISVLLILLVVGLIAQSTLRMSWGDSPAGRMLRLKDSDGTASLPLSVYSSRDSVTLEAGNAMPFFAPQSPTMGGPGASSEDREKLGQKVIRTGNLIMRVDSAEKRMNELRAIVDNVKGFVAQANLTDNANVKTAYVTLRIPSDKYDATVAQIKGLASTVFNESTSGDDVTDQFVDLQARLGAAKAEEAQYLEILKRAGTIEETLQVTGRLGEVRSRIEQMEGQMRFLQDRTDYATLSITMTEEAKIQIPTQAWKPGETLRLSLRALVVALQGMVDVVIAGGVFLIGLLLPILLVLGLIGWLIRSLWRKFIR